MIRSNSAGVDISYFDPSFKLTIAGEEVGPDINRFIDNVEYESIDGMADMAKFTILNWEGRFTDSKMFQPGNEVNFAFGYGAEVQHVGRIIISKPKFIFPDGDIPSIEVKGYTKDFLMMDNQPALTKTKGKKPNKRAFSKPAQLRDIVETVISEYDMDLDFIGDKTFNRGFVQKAGTTDYDFLKGLANFAGYVMWVDGDESGTWTMHFVKPDETTGLLNNADVQEEPKLFEYNRGDASTLFSFDPEFALRNAKQKMVVVSRDPDTGKTFTEVVEDTESAPDVVAEGADPNKKATEDAKSKESHIKLIFGDDISIDVVANKKFRTAAEVKEWARQWFRRHRQEFIQGRGQLIGQPDVMARQVHAIKGIGTTFDGDYYFDRVRHILNSSSGYMIDFQAKKVLP